MFTPEHARFLQDSVIPLRLACRTESGWPVVVSLWFLLDGQALYCATPATARTVSYLRADSRCAFEVAGDQPPYRGVRGQAVASLEPHRGSEILKRLLKRYLESTEVPLARQLLARQTPEMAIRLEPVNVAAWDYRRRMRDSLPSSD